MDPSAEDGGKDRKRDDKDVRRSHRKKPEDGAEENKERKHRHKRATDDPERESQRRRHHKHKERTGTADDPDRKHHRHHRKDVKDSKSGTSKSGKSKSEGSFLPPNNINNIELFNEQFGSGPVVLEDCSKLLPLREFRSDPNTPLPLDVKFDLLGEPYDGLKIKSASLEDVNVLLNHYPELLKKDCPGEHHHPLSERVIHVKMDDRMRSAYESLAQIENDRFSLYDAIVKTGQVLESIEIPKGEDITEFVVADDKHLKEGINYGRVVFKTKNSYTGNMKKWYFHGPGRYTWTDGTIYQGNFRDGEMDGEGVIIWPDKSSYEGEFAEGARNGWGVLTLSDKRTYAGEWLHGLPHGKGKIWFDGSDASNDYYDGEWRNGVEEGHGTRQYANGDRYVGGWKDGTRNGHGTFIWFNERQVFRGHWKNGVPEGQGEHVWYLPRTGKSLFPTRHIYIGEWHEGMRQGVGRMVYSCGSLYEGHWESGMRHDKGLYVNSSGDVLIGLFRAGSIAGGVDVPLHSPTYECDFKGVTIHLGDQFGLEDFVTGEDVKLGGITVQYIKELRQLYKMAGDLAYWWGDNGHYPMWAKKNTQNLGRNQEELHCENLKDMNLKPPSPDGVYPLTRLGLWLLIRDCTELDEKVAISHFDDLFNSIPSISFQTWHNPFEPIFLWQFLQCLVAIAAVVYIELPLKKKLGKESTDIVTKEECTELLNSTEVVEEKDSKTSVATTDSATGRIENKPKPPPKNPYLQKASKSSKPAEADLNISMSKIIRDPKESKGGLETIDEESSLRLTKKPAKRIKTCFEMTGKFSESVSFSRAYENLIKDILIPWMKRVPGENLPTIPKPLPPLTDLFESFRNANKGEDSMRINQLLDQFFPPSSNSNENIKSRKSDNRKGLPESSDTESTQSEAPSTASQAENEEELTILGLKIGHISQERKNSFLTDFNTLVEFDRKNPGKGDESDMESEINEEELVLESTPFGDEDLIPEPFLWKQELKCKLINKSLQAFANLTREDITLIMRHLYPKLCSKDADFKILFCDWIWIYSLCAKVSSERDFSVSAKRLAKYEEVILEKGRNKLDEKKCCPGYFPRNTFPGVRAQKSKINLAVAAYMNTRKPEIARVKYSLS